MGISDNNEEAIRQLRDSEWAQEERQKEVEKIAKKTEEEEKKRKDK